MALTQLSFADTGFECSRKYTHTEVFPETMLAAISWASLSALIAQHAPRAETGRPAFPIPVMLRIHFLQQWYALSDPHMEVKLHLTAIYRAFAILDHGLIIIPDETTILRFRYLLEKHGLARQFLKIIDALVRACGLHIRRGTTVDATIISAPSSTRNWGRK